MLIKIVSAPKGSCIDDIALVSCIFTGKVILVHNAKSGELEIREGDQKDIQNLKKRGITVERIPE